VYLPSVPDRPEGGMLTSKGDTVELGYDSSILTRVVLLNLS
jgi:hypothetical protein